MMFDFYFLQFSIEENQNSPFKDEKWKAECGF